MQKWLSEIYSTPSHNSTLPDSCPPVLRYDEKGSFGPNNGTGLHFMQASQKLVDFITTEEGSVSRAYRDPVGIITIGVGHTSAAGGLQVKMGMELSAKQISDLLREDLRKFMARCKIAMLNAKQHEIEGATSFDFNTGAINKASWVKFWAVDDVAQARRRFKLWNKAGGKVLLGLAARRRREAAIIFDNKWPDMGRPSAAVISVSHQSDYILQLVKLGYLEKGATIGPAVNDAVELFQFDKRLIVDGIVGPATRATLQRAVAAKAVERTGLASGVASSGGSIAFADVSTATMIGVGLLIAVLVGGWVWRNRGRLFGVRAQTITNGAS